MNLTTNQTGRPAKACLHRSLRRVASTGAVIAVVVAAIGLPVIVPEATDGVSPTMAIARADCPPDCGGGPGNGGTPSGPPGGGTEFAPPSMPATPSYEPGRGYPAPDQNNGVSIYNSATPQPSQAAQPSQAPIQNQDGTYSRAANGQQQPINYNNAPDNQQLNNDWQKLSDQLNQQHSDSPENQSQSQNNQDTTNSDKTCESVISQLGDSAFIFEQTGTSEDTITARFSDQAITALTAAGLTPKQCTRMTESAAYDTTLDVDSQKYKCPRVTLQQIKDELTRPGGFGSNFPVAGAPADLPKIDDVMNLKAPVPVPGLGNVATVHIPGLGDFDLMDAPVKILSLTNSPDFFEFKVEALPGHFDGAGSTNTFRFFVDPNGFAHLVVASHILDAPAPKSAYELITPSVWQPFLANVINHITGSSTSCMYEPSPAPVGIPSPPAPKLPALPSEPWPELPPNLPWPGVPSLPKWPF